MPSGKVHDRITIVGAAVAAPAWWWLAPRDSEPSVGAALVGSILFSGLLLSPDLDLNSSIYHRWGPFKYLWWPYQKLLPHRSPLSHSLLGALLRVIYFVVVLWALAHSVAWIAAQAGNLNWRVSKNPLDLARELWAHYPRHVEMGALGLAIGTVLHTGADSLSTFWKKRT